MGEIWVVGPLAAGIVGVLLFFLGLGHVARGRPATGSGHVVVGFPLAVGGFALGLLGVNTQTYSRLTYEAPVAQVSVKLLDRATSRYAVTVHRLDGSNRTQTCTLQGDDWVLSGRVQKWKPWANILGLDATYTLNQLTNMYSTAERGNGKLITACDIQGPPPKINQYLPDDWVGWLMRQSFSVDRKFGDANFMPMADGAVYKVVITQSGFNAQPENDIAKKANEAAG